MSRRKVMTRICAQKGWTLIDTQCGYIISNGYEEIGVECCGEDAFLTTKKILGGTNDQHIKKLDIVVYPSTAKNIATHLEQIFVIKNEDQYLKYWANIIADTCKQLNVRCEYKFGLIYLVTDVEEFYIDTDPCDLQKFSLFHRGVEARGIKSAPYHRQLKTGLTYDNVAQYVYKHTSMKYGNISKGE